MMRLPNPRRPILTLGSFCRRRQSLCLSIEYVSEQRTIWPPQDCIARAGNPDSGRHFIQKPYRCDFVRHRDQRAPDICQLKERTQQIRLVFTLDAHRHHSGIDTRVLKVRIVDHGRFEGRRGIAYMRNEDRIAIDHSRRLLTLPQFGTSNGVLNAAIDVHA